MHQDFLSIESHNACQNTTDSKYAKDWCITARGQRFSYQQYRQDVHCVANKLPDDCRYAFNVCQDRYNFLVGLHAVALKGQTNLLPPNQAPGTQRELLKQYASCYIINDTTPFTDLPVQVFQLDLSSQHIEQAADCPDIDVPSNHLAVILFTSGTSGEPSAIAKRWGDLRVGVQLTAAHLGLDDWRERHLVATVPPQHMFGLEISIILPLISGIGFISNRPFFPEDIRQTLNSTPGRSVLVTTPIHLKACINSGLNWSESGCDLILCATAPLTREVAARAEEQFGAPVKEIYGTTETGALASRRTTEGDEWRFYPGISVQPSADGYLVTGKHLITPCRINDRLLIHDNGRFKLLGRPTDMLKLAGKRASLNELNEKLNRISGVIDGVYIDTAKPGEETRRLAAAVVAPGMTRKDLLDALADWVDPVFLPRPVLFLDSLPRNETGKLTQDVLQALLAS